MRLKQLQIVLNNFKLLGISDPKVIISNQLRIYNFRDFCIIWPHMPECELSESSFHLQLHQKTSKEKKNKEIILWNLFLFKPKNYIYPCRQTYGRKRKVQSNLRRLGFNLRRTYWILINQFQTPKIVAKFCTIIFTVF